MDLNRDLPTLPLTTDSQSLELDENSHQHKLESILDCTLELLQPLYYDPVRDSLKYGGIHYHTDGMHYHPEVHQYPPRTSSMPRPSTPLDASVGTIHHQVKAGDRLKPSPGTPHASDASYSSETSSGIMGNFIPVKTAASPSLIVTRAVHVPRIEINCDMRVTGQNSKPNPTPETASSQVLTYTQNVSDKTDYSKLEDSNRIIVKGLGGLVVPKNVHDSIDLNEAPAKYIQHLKKMKKQSTQRKKQSLGSNYLLPQNFDDEADKSAGNNETDDRTAVDSDEDAEAPHVIAQDYSEIRAGNPFQLEPDDIQNDPDRLTTFTDFMGGTNKTYERLNPQQLRKVGHLKNSHSESNALYMKKRPEPIQVFENDTSRDVLHRSGSSPNISPTGITSRGGAEQGSLQSFYHEDDHSYSRTVDGSEYVIDLSRSPPRGRGFSRVSPRQLDDVPESREISFETLSPSQKHPWSPVKKIFGEGGWLSNNANSKEESTTPKKPGLVEKIKLKIEEIGLKADLSPIKYPFRSDQERSWEHSTFPISLNPSQQAELYLDIELLICDSANTFLMHEYQNGRMSVDSLKKVTDFWKSKGRPQVVEFHYDQSTQRDLIVANQKTFRFYGLNANDPLKVHAMLYAWKTNAREMAVRTFCYPDSMIRKHIRDTFVMLDFLGGHPFQYIAAHEVQAKLIGWIKEAQVHITSRSSAPSPKRVGRRSNEPLTGLVINNPWHHASKPIQLPSKQSSWSSDS